MLIPMVLRDTNDTGKDAQIWHFLEHAYTTLEYTPLKRLAVEKMTRLASRLIPLRDWIKGFPDGLLIDFTEALMREIGTVKEGSPRPKLPLFPFLVPEDDE